MKHKLISTYTIVAAGILASALLILPFFSVASNAESLFSGCNGEIVDATNIASEEEVAELVNIQRSEKGLPPLKLITELSNAARYHSTDMKQDDYFEHDSYDVSGATTVMVCRWYKRLAKYYTGSTLGENIAWGYGSPQSVMDGWMNSTGHRENILSPDFYELGVGYNSRYWVQDFGRRSEIYPLIINGEARQTESSVVQLYIYGDSWTEMRLRNDDGAWGEWQSFQHQLQWTLNDSAGMHTVSAEMRNATNTTSSSDTIELLLQSVEPTFTATPLATTPAPTPTPTATATPVFAGNEFVGNVTLQGRPAAPHSSWQAPLKVDFIEQGALNPTRSLTLLTDNRGQFDVADPPQGTFHISVKGDHTLRRIVSANIVSGKTEVNIGELYEGDIILDNHINLLDFSAMTPYYLSCSGQSNFTKEADLNTDGCVNDVDVNLIRGNFDLKGDSLPNADILLSSAVMEGVYSDIDIAQIIGRKAGDKFVLTVNIGGPPSGEVDSGALYINFDPSKLKIVSLTPLSPFQVLLSSHIDNQNGQADLAAGLLGKGVQTPFQFATILLEAVTDIESTAVSLSLADSRRTDLAGRGNSLLTDPQNSEFSFDSEQSTLNNFVYLPTVQR